MPNNLALSVDFPGFFDMWNFFQTSVHSATFVGRINLKFCPEIVLNLIYLLYFMSFGPKMPLLGRKMAPKWPNKKLQNFQIWSWIKASYRWDRIKTRSDLDSGDSNWPKTWLWMLIFCQMHFSRNTLFCYGALTRLQLRPPRSSWIFDLKPLPAL